MRSGQAGGRHLSLWLPHWLVPAQWPRGEALGVSSQLWVCEPRGQGHGQGPLWLDRASSKVGPATITEAPRGPPRRPPARPPLPLRLAAGGDRKAGC